jgi:hypothetical protein
MVLTVFVWCQTSPRELCCWIKDHFAPAFEKVLISLRSVFLVTAKAFMLDFSVRVNKVAGFACQSNGLGLVDFM